MSFGGSTGFIAGAARIVLGVESAQFNADLAVAEGTFVRTAEGMSGAAGEIAERTIRSSVALERYNRMLRQTGAASLEARSALASYIGEMRRLNDVQNQSTASLSRFERGMVAGGVRGVGMGRALSFASNAFLGGAGFVYAVHSAVKASSEFQAEMRLLQTQALKSRGEVDRMTVSVKKLAGPLATDPLALAKGLYHVESAGYAGAKALRILTTAAKGARLGHSDLEQTTNALVAAQRSGIRGAHDLGQTMGTLDAIVGGGNTRMEDLTKAIASGVIPAAQGAGVSLGQFGAALDTLTVHGVPAELAATRLRYSIALLSVQTPKAAKELKSIGLDAGVLGEKMTREGLVPALELLSTKLKQSGFDMQGQHEILERSFGGGRSYTTILDLIQHLDQLRDRTNLIAKEGTSKMFDERWQAQVHTAEYAFDRLKASAETLKIEIGDALLPATVKAADGISTYLGKAVNQARVTRDVKEALHDGGEAAQVFGHALHQLGDVLHITDTLLGGTGHSLKLLVEALLLRKALGFAKTINKDFLDPLRGVKHAADEAQDSLAGLGGGPGVVRGGAIAPAGVPVWRVTDWERQQQASTALADKAKQAEALARDDVTRALDAETLAQGKQTASTASSTEASDVETDAQNTRAAALERVATAYADVDVAQTRAAAVSAAPAAGAAELTAAEQRRARIWGAAGEPARPTIPDLELQQRGLVAYLQAKHPETGEPVRTEEQLTAGREKLVGVNQALASARQSAILGVRSTSVATGEGTRYSPTRQLPVPVGGDEIETKTIARKLHVRRGDEWFLPTPEEKARIAEREEFARQTVTVPSSPQARPGRSTAPLPASEYVTPPTVVARGLIEGARQGAVVVRTTGSTATAEQAADAQAEAEQARLDADARQQRAAAARARADAAAAEARAAEEAAAEAKTELRIARQAQPAKAAQATKLSKAEQAERQRLQQRIETLNRQMTAVRRGELPTGGTMIGGIPHLPDENGDYWRADLATLERERAQAQAALEPLTVTKQLPTRAVTQRGILGTTVGALEKDAAGKRQLAEASSQAAAAAEKEAAQADKVARARQIEAEQTQAAAEATAKLAAEQAALAEAEKAATAAAITDLKATVAAAKSPTPVSPVTGVRPSALPASVASSLDAAITKGLSSDELAVRKLREARAETQRLREETQRLIDVRTNGVDVARRGAAVDEAWLKTLYDENGALVAQTGDVEKLTLAKKEAARTSGVPATGLLPGAADPVRARKVEGQLQGGEYGPVYLGGRRLRGGLSTGDEELFLAEKEQSLSRMRTMRAGVGRAGSFMTSEEGMQGAMGAGMALMFAPQFVPGMQSGYGAKAGNILTGAGAGMMFGPMLRVNPYLAAGVGASFGLKSAIGGSHGSTRQKVGSVIGNVGEGAALGAVAGSVIGPEGTAAGAGIGAAVGAAAGLGIALVGLMHHVDHTSADLIKLSTASATAGRNLSVAKLAVFQGANQVSYDRASRYQAGQALKEAAEQEKAARGTQAHAAAVLQLRAAQAQWREANRLVITDLHNLEQAHKDVEKRAGENRKAQSALVHQLSDVGRETTRTATVVRAAGRGMATAFATPAQKAEMYADKMDKIAEKARATNPKLARTATALANVAREMGKIPTDPKYIRVILKFGYDPRSLQQTEQAVKAVFGDFLNGPFGKGLLPSDLTPGDTGTQVRWNGKAWVGPNGKPIRNQQLAWDEFRKLHPKAGPVKPWRNAHVPMPRGGNAAPHSRTNPGAAPAFVNPSEAPTLTHLDAQISAIQAGEQKGDISKLLQEELAFLRRDYQRATNDVQRKEVTDAINQIKSQQTTADSKSLRNGGLGLLPPKYQNAINSALQSDNKPKAIAGYQAAEGWLRTYMSHHAKDSLAYKKANDLLTQIHHKLTRLTKAVEGNPSALIPKTLQNRYQVALQNAETGGGAAKELRGERATVAAFLKKHPGDKDAKAKLAGIDQELGQMKGGYGAVIDALDAEIHWLKEYKRKHAGSIEAILGANKAIAALEKKRATAEGKGGQLSSRPAWMKLQNTLYKAEQTETKTDDIKALKGEQSYLKSVVAQATAKHDLKLQATANKLLAGIDGKLAKLIKTGSDQLKALENLFLSEQASFWSSFGSNDFTTDENGARTVGSPSIRTQVNVTQQFPHPPSADGHREARVAAAAMSAAYD